MDICADFACTELCNGETEAAIVYEGIYLVSQIEQVIMRHNSMSAEIGLILHVVLLAEYLSNSIEQLHSCLCGRQKH